MGIERSTVGITPDGCHMLHFMIVAILMLMIVVMLVMKRIEEDIIKRYHLQGGPDLNKNTVARHRNRESESSSVD
jgi:hypothetical protein